MNVLIAERAQGFSNSLRQLLAEFDVKAKIVTYEALIDQENINQYDGLILASGSGNPNEIKHLDELLQIKAKLPILGIGLGMQILIHLFGGDTVKAKKASFGVISKIKHNEKGLFNNLPKNFNVVRYHSLIADRNNFPSSQFMIIAESKDDKAIMAIKHRAYPIEAVQFNLESVKTDYKMEILENFINVIKNTKLNYF